MVCNSDSSFDNLLVLPEFVSSDLQMRFLLFPLQLLQTVVVLLRMLDTDVAFLLDLVVTINLHVFQNTVSIDY